MNKYFITTFLFLILLIKLALTQKQNYQTNSATTISPTSTPVNTTISNPSITKAVTEIENYALTTLKPTNNISNDLKLEEEETDSQQTNMLLKFNSDYTEVYYRNMMDSCNRRIFKLKIIDSIKLLVNNEINFMNKKKKKDKYIFLNIDKFIRYGELEENKVIEYDIYAFILNFQTNATHKYKFELLIDDNKLFIKNIEIYNVDTPIKRFTCEDSIDCSERNSSLKQKFTDNFIPNIYDTALDYDIFKNPKNNSININLNKNRPILNKNMIQKTTFPCRKKKFSWDVNGIEYVPPAEKDCYGINSAMQQLKITPYYHTSLFNKFNFDDKTAINNVFDWKNQLNMD